MQPSLLDVPAQFDGETFEPAQDQVRLTGQLERVKALMLDGRWRTLAGIQVAVGGSEAGISARLRDLRKVKFGAYTVNLKRSRRGGLWYYQVTR